MFMCIWCTLTYSRFDESQLSEVRINNTLFVIIEFFLRTKISSNLTFSRDCDLYKGTLEKKKK